MKKLLYILLFVTCFTSQASAQKSISYQVKVNYEGGLFKYFCESAGAELVAHYPLNKEFSIGLGTGVSYTNQDYYEEGLAYDIAPCFKENGLLCPIPEGPPTSVVNMFIPLFAQLKYTLGSHKVKPYVLCDGGYSFFISLNHYSDDTTLGAFVRPAIGLAFKNGLSAEIGWKYQHRKDRGYGMSYHQLVLAVGYSF